MRIASATRDHYTHVSEQRRGEAMDALQKRWETALMERAALEAVWGQAGIPRRSTAPLLDRLLEPYRDAAVSQILQPRNLRRRAVRQAGRSSLLADGRGWWGASAPGNRTFKIRFRFAPGIGHRPVPGSEKPAGWCQPAGSDLRHICVGDTGIEPVTSSV
ncbi:hypothetical protein GCM10010485_47770 [Streptosporangium carneum]